MGFKAQSYPGRHASVPLQPLLHAVGWPGIKQRQRGKYKTVLAPALFPVGTQMCTSFVGGINLSGLGGHTEHRLLVPPAATNIIPHPQHVPSWA